MLPADTTASAAPSPTAAHGADERRVGLGPHGLGRLVVHRHDTVGDDVLEARRVEIRRAEQDRLDLGRDAPRARRRRPPRARGRRRARRRPREPAQASRFLGRGCAQRLDVAAAVRLARRAHAVRLLRRPAVRAGADARRLDAVLGATLVAPGLAGLPLRDGHERLHTVAKGRVAHAPDTSLRPRMSSCPRERERVRT